MSRDGLNGEEMRAIDRLRGDLWAFLRGNESVKVYARGCDR